MNRFRKLTKVFILVLICFVAAPLKGQKDSANTNKKVKVLPVPTLGVSPETDFYVGAVALFALDFYQDGITRKSNAKAEITYTWNKQIILELGWDYFFEREEWFTQGRLHFSKYPDRYYGIGATTPESNETWFGSNRIIGDISFLKSLKPKMFLGPEVSYLSYRDVKPEGDIVFEELYDRSNFALFLVYLWDNRNNLLNSTKGSYLRASSGYSWNGEANNPTGELDGRLYKTFKEKYTLAFRSFTHVNFGSPTFYNQAILGGDRFVRGFLYGRFRDANLSTLQLESRNHLFWRIGISLFGGYSFLFDDINATYPEQFKYNFGGGLRILVDKKDNINLRFDYAVGQDGQTGFYVAFGESF
jgi:outer membrane protein assembly factor BamA